MSPQRITPAPGVGEPSRKRHKVKESNDDSQHDENRQCSEAATNTDSENGNNGSSSEDEDASRRRQLAAVDEGNSSGVSDSERRPRYADDESASEGDAEMIEADAAGLPDEAEVDRDQQAETDMDTQASTLADRAQGHGTRDGSCIARARSAWMIFLAENRDKVR